MNDPDDDLRSYFAGRLPDRLSELAAARDDARGAGWSGEPLRRFHRLAHSLAGTGATFGFDAVSEHARALEVLLEPRLQGRGEIDDGEVGALLERLRAAAV